MLYELLADSFTETYAKTIYVPATRVGSHRIQEYREDFLILLVGFPEELDHIEWIDIVIVKFFHSVYSNLASICEQSGLHFSILTRTLFKHSPIAAGAVWEQVFK